MEAGIEWEGAHSPRKGEPFAKVPLQTPATRVAELLDRRFLGESSFELFDTVAVHDVQGT
jgi:hypothetical protein